MVRLRLAAFALAATAAGSLPHAAQAYWRGGVFFGFAPPVFFYPPPLVYAPPVYYARPPVVYDPQVGTAGPAVPVASCEAGAYICPLTQPARPGTPCSCPTERGGRAGGLVR